MSRKELFYVCHFLILFLLCAPTLCELQAAPIRLGKYTINFSSKFTVKSYNSAHLECQRQNSHLAVFARWQDFDSFISRLHQHKTKFNIVEGELIQWRN